MVSNDVDSLAGFHFRNLAESNPAGYGNSLVIHELGQLGVGTVLIPSKEAYSPDASSVVAHTARIIRSNEGLDTLVYDEPLEYQVGQSESGIDVVRARLLTPKDLEEKVPVINGPSLRKIGASKWRQYELAREYMPKTVAISSGEGVSEELLDQIPGERVVVKADMGQDSSYLKVVEKSAADAAVIDIRSEFEKIEKSKGKARANERILLQEFRPGEALRELRPLNEQDKEKLAAAEQSELRVYCFVDAAHAIQAPNRFYATARTFSSADSDWAHVDQASVPAEVWRTSEVVSDRVVEAAGVRGGYFAIDMFKSDGQYMVREINTRDPMLVDTDESFLEALKQRKLLANLMASLATK